LLLDAAAINNNILNAMPVDCPLDTLNFDFPPFVQQVLPYAYQIVEPGEETNVYIDTILDFEELLQYEFYALKVRVSAAELEASFDVIVDVGCYGESVIVPTSGFVPYSIDWDFVLALPPTDAADVDRVF
jgi:hypothetical protein